ncbi:MAG: hypothetical protein J5825_11575 [Lachnospiraceae bacterium]|nr:hypothetical protein [Lachnospiraceae bacterium]
MQDQSRSVLEYIRRCSVKKIFFPVGICILVVLILFMLPFFQQISPITIENGKALAEHFEAGDYFVTEQTDMLYYTGMDYYRNSRLAGHLYYHLNEDATLLTFYILPTTMGSNAEETVKDLKVTGRLISLQEQQLDPSYTGRRQIGFLRLFGKKNPSANGSPSSSLENTTSYSRVIEDLAARTGYTRYALNNISSPIAISTVDYYSRLDQLYYVTLGILFLAALITAIRHLMIIIAPRCSAAALRLYQYGHPSQILKEVDEQIRHQCLIQTKDMVLTTDYLVEFSEDISAIIPLSEVLWTYEHATLWQSPLVRYKKRLTYTLHITMENGEIYVFNHKWKEDVDLILRELSDSHPNFFIGYSDAHLEMVKHILQERRQEKISLFIDHFLPFLSRREA